MHCLLSKLSTFSSRKGFVFSSTDWLLRSVSSSNKAVPRAAVNSLLASCILVNRIGKVSDLCLLHLWHIFEDDSPLKEQLGATRILAEERE